MIRKCFGPGMINAIIKKSKLSVYWITQGHIATQYSGQKKEEDSSGRCQGTILAFTCKD
jgi:hypothetical protein